MTKNVLDDGLCVFDIYTRDEHVVDEARWVDFRDAAYNLIHDCVIGRDEDAEGGIATNIGKLYQAIWSKPLCGFATCIRVVSCSGSVLNG